MSVLTCIKETTIKLFNSSLVNTFVRNAFRCYRVVTKIYLHTCRLKETFWHTKFLSKKNCTHHGTIGAWRTFGIGYSQSLVKFETFLTAPVSLMEEPAVSLFGTLKFEISLCHSDGPQNCFQFSLCCDDYRYVVFYSLTIFEEKIQDQL